MGSAAPDAENVQIASVGVVNFQFQGGPLFDIGLANIPSGAHQLFAQMVENPAAHILRSVIDPPELGAVFNSQLLHTSISTGTLTSI